LLIVAKFIPFFELRKQVRIERLFVEEIIKFVRFSPHCARIGIILSRGDNMGIMDMIQSLGGQTGQAAGTDQAKVAGGFIEALTQHPEGVQGVLDAFKNNGMAEHVGAWSTGATSTATPEQVQQGLGGTGLIEKTAEKAGVSPEVVKVALATVLPMVIKHFAPNGQATPQSSMGSMAQQFLSKFV
jgi:uncharacterized protein YidB (DUF937 family)